MSKSRDFRSYDEDRRQLSVAEWEDILQDDNLTMEACLDVIKVIFDAPNHALNAGDVAKKLGYSSHATVTRKVVNWAKKIMEAYDLPVGKEKDSKYWPLFFYGKDGHPFWWQLKPELAEAVELVCAFSEPLESVVTTVSATEGKKRQYYVVRYERKPENRAAAIRLSKAKSGELCCSVCGFNFEKTYGDLGAGFIEVHHIKPLFDYDEEVKIDPAADLICLCSNCHSMIHREKYSVLEPEVLKAIVDGRRQC